MREAAGGVCRCRQSGLEEMEILEPARGRLARRASDWDFVFSGPGVRRARWWPGWWLLVGRRGSQAAAQWIGSQHGVDSPCAAQTRPSPTNPERPPLFRCIDVLTESWCAALHQAVLCAQRQDVVVAHQPGVGGYFTNQFTPAR